MKKGIFKKILKNFEFVNFCYKKFGFFEFLKIFHRILKIFIQNLKIFSRDFKICIKIEIFFIGF